MKIHLRWLLKWITNLGATKDDKVMVLSGKVWPGFGVETATITKQSPEGTALTLPLYHPVVAVAVDDAINDLQEEEKRMH